jgi:hypothetical protein
MSHAITRDLLRAAEDHVLWFAAFLIVIGSL